MNVLILSPYPSSLISCLVKEGDNSIIHNDYFDIPFLLRNNIDFVVSYGYKFIVQKDIIEHMKNRIINLHISFLPFNKGSHPNLWSHVEGTLSGVTIHQIEEGIDTGKILLRKEIKLDSKDHTFRSSYKILRDQIEELFKQNWVKIKNNEIDGFYAKEQGTFHYKREGEKLLSDYNINWEMNIKDALNQII